MTEYTSQLQTAEEKPHKKPNYIGIFLFLAIITVIEVTVAASMPLVLVLLSLSKVVLVALYYMHLKFESGIFSAIFLSPIPFVLLITIALVVALAPGADNSAAAASLCSFW
ncbi:MAG: cytochrome C oxidase subunit IV family protein [Anaerolineae bacterium]|nr:cytochrome C oxidase subunit IV family protein [Anaerolineae bacterium]